MTMIMYIIFVYVHYYELYIKDTRMGTKQVSNRSTRLPIPIQRALSILGNDIRNARRRRRIPCALLAERASISRTTLVKIEKGEPGVSLGAYAHVLMSLGLIDRLSSLADPKQDEIGLMLEEERLPQRIRKISH